MAVDEPVEGVKRVLEREVACPRRAVEAVLRGVELLVPEARVYQYLGGTGLTVIVVVVPKGYRRSWVSYALSRFAEDEGIDLYSLVNLVVLKEDELDRLFPYGRGRLKQLKGPEDLECTSDAPQAL